MTAIEDRPISFYVTVSQVGDNGSEESVVSWPARAPQVPDRLRGELGRVAYKPLGVLRIDPPDAVAAFALEASEPFVPDVHGYCEPGHDDLAVTGDELAAGGLESVHPAGVPKGGES